MFRFTIRDVLWLNVVIVLAIICWQRGDGYTWQQRARSAVRALEADNRDTSWRKDGIVVTTTVRHSRGKLVRSIFYGPTSSKLLDEQHVLEPKPDAGALYQ